MTDSDRQEANDRRAAFIQALRDCADFYERHPAVEAPYSTTFNVFVATREEMSLHARAATWEKDYSDDWFMLRKTFGPLTLDINTSRERVCRKVVTGTRTIPAQPERVVEEIEWVCEDALLAVVE